MIIHNVTFDSQCNTLCFAVLNNIAQLKFEFQKKKKKKKKKRKKFLKSILKMVLVYYFHQSEMVRCTLW